MKIEQLIKYWAGECTDSEKKAVETWMNENPEHRHAINRLQKIWERKVSKADNRRFNSSAAWVKLNDEMEKLDQRERLRLIQTPRPWKTGSLDRRKRTYTGMTGLIIAAALLLVAAFTALFISSISDESGQQVFHELITERGERRNIYLSDGSFINLNAESRLSYRQEFESGMRKVHLEGESYFRVASDERPFYVYTDDALIRVVGTEFNVKSYKDEDHVNVLVASGKVAVRPATGSVTDEVILNRGDMVRISRNGKGEMVIDRDVDVMFHLGWLEERILFRNTPLQEVARNLERMYNVDIRFADPGLSEIPLTAEFEGESINEILVVMQYALNIKYEVKNREVIFYGK